MFGLVPYRRGRGLIDGPRLFDLMDRMWEGLLPAAASERGEWVPSFDVSETENEVIVRADMPGIDVKDLDISVTGNVLTISGEKKSERDEKKEGYHLIERTFGSFTRSMTLPGEVKADEVTATYKDGVLKLVIPKTEAAKRKKIEVKVEH